MGDRVGERVLRVPCVSRVLRGLAAAGDLVLPARCASCHGPGPPLCRTCAHAVRTASGGWPALVGGDAGPRGMPPCWAAARFEGPLRLAVTAYKDEGRRDLRPALGRLLAAAVTTAVTTDDALRERACSGEPVLVVPLPTSRSSRRRRGDDPVGDLARYAAASDPGRGLVVAPALAHTRRVADQAHLDRARRAANLAGAIEVPRRWLPVVRGAACVLVDDVVTTGSTLAEAARALRRAGAGHVVAATVGATPRRL